MKKYLVITVVIIGIIGSCRKGKNEEVNNSKNEEIHSVFITTPSSQGSRITKHFSGMVKEAEEINLGFRTPGQIEKIYVKEGEYIKQGQVVARLDQEDYKLDVESKQVQYDQLISEVARMRQLYEDNSLSGNDFEKAEARLKDLKVQLEISKNKLKYTTLKAPVSGYVQNVEFEEAEMVNTGTAIISLINVNFKEVECDIPTSLYIKRSLFSGFSCTASVFPKEKYPLELVTIVPKANGIQLYKVTFRLGSEDAAKLTAGMNVEIAVHLSDTTNNRNFILPLSSIFNKEGKTYVWKLQSDSTVSKCEVLLNGVDEHGEAIVSGNLNKNENIIKAGINVLQENEKVHVISEPAKTNIGGLL